jgi:hypothetical protein
MDDLHSICRDMRHEMSPQVFQRIASWGERVQVCCAIEMIRKLWFVRTQMSRILEHMTDETIAELHTMDRSASRPDDWVKHYLYTQRKSQPFLTRELAAVSQMFAAGFNHMEDRLDQLEHPAIHQSSFAQDIIKKPRGPLCDIEIAQRRFFALVDAL